MTVLGVAHRERLGCVAIHKPRSTAAAAPPAEGLHATTPLFVLPLDLEREVPFVSHLRNLVKLRLEPVDMLLLVLEER